MRPVLLLALVIFCCYDVWADSLRVSVHESMMFSETTNVSAVLVINIDLLSICGTTASSRFGECWRFCMTALKWFQQGDAVALSQEQLPFTGYSCDCSTYGYGLRATSATTAMGPTEVSSEYVSIISEAKGDRVQTTYNFPGETCVASYCVLSGNAVLGVEPSQCNYGSSSYYSYSWWVIMIGCIIALVFGCGCIAMCCFASKRRQANQEGEILEGGRDKPAYGQAEEVPLAVEIQSNGQQPATQAVAVQ